MKRIKELDNAITNEEFVKILSQLPGSREISIAGDVTFSIMDNDKEGIILMDDSAFIMGLFEDEEDYQKALEAFPEETKTEPKKEIETMSEYILIRTTEDGSIGGNSRKMTVVGRSKDKKALQRKLKEIVKKALTDKTVELINDYEKEEIELDDFVVDNEISIDFLVEGMTIYDKEIYTIIEA